MERFGYYLFIVDLFDGKLSFIYKDLIDMDIIINGIINILDGAVENQLVVIDDYLLHRFKHILKVFKKDVFSKKSVSVNLI